MGPFNGSAILIFKGEKLIFFIIKYDKTVSSGSTAVGSNYVS